jgi:4-amino-4-deoxy-L-arabinose transferase-like glycosyltransferase
MQRKDRIQFFLLWLFLGVVPLFLRPLWEPGEARYAEISREMLVTGDWLTPRLNQVPCLDMPPLQYWLSAVSMKLFGVNAAAARLPLALATLILLGCVWRLSRRLGASQPLWGAFMAGTTLLAYGCHQFLAPDALFSAWFVLSLVAAIEAVSARLEGRPALGWTLLAFGANALALLTKGLAAPVLLGGILLGSTFWAWPSPALRKAVARLLMDPLGWPLFVAIGAPWFVMVERVHPGHAWDSFLSGHFVRPTGNPLVGAVILLGALLAGLLPWLAASVIGFRHAVEFLRRRGGPQSEWAPLHRWTVAVLVLAFVMPVLFFSLSATQRIPGLLPVVAPLLALACAFEREDEAWLALKRSGRELLAMGTLFTLAGPMLFKGNSHLGWILGVGIAFVGLGLWAIRPRNLTGPRWMVALGAGMLLLSLAARNLAVTP